MLGGKCTIQYHGLYIDSSSVLQENKNCIHGFSVNLIANSKGQQVPTAFRCVRKSYNQYLCNMGAAFKNPITGR